MKIDSTIGIKIKCDRDKINKKLDTRKIHWLVSRLNEIGIAIEYKALVNLLNGHSDWRLLYAVGLCKIFQCKIGDIFYFENNGEKISIDFV